MAGVTVLVEWFRHGELEEPPVVPRPVAVAFAQLVVRPFVRRSPKRWAGRPARQP